MRYTIASTYQMREMFTMIVQQLLSVFWLVASQQGAAGFVLAPNHIHKIHKSGISSKASSRNTSILSSFPTEQESDESKGIKEEEPEVRENDLSMFLKSKEEEAKGQGGFDPLEFFMTIDESIEKLEEVENFFREEPMGIMMEEQTGVIPSTTEERTVSKEHIATTNPIASDMIQLEIDTDSIVIDEKPVSKKVMYYDYDGSLTKIKSNLCDSPVIYYTE